MVFTEWFVKETGRLNTYRETIEETKKKNRRLSFRNVKNEFVDEVKESTRLDKIRSLL